MKLEDQVCSCQLAHRLKELGVKQESLYDWVEHYDDDGFGWSLFNHDEDDKVNKTRAAFTVCELLDLLPQGFSVGSQFFQDKKLYECFPIFPAATSDSQADELEKFAKIPFDQEKNPADAAAKMLIYLIEQGMAVS